MKLFFSLILIQYSQAAMVEVTFKTHTEKLQQVQKIIREMKIPDELIAYEQSSAPCIPRQRPLLHFCLDKENTLHLLQAKNDQIRKTLGVFIENK